MADITVPTIGGDSSKPFDPNSSTDLFSRLPTEINSAVGGVRAASTTFDSTLTNAGAQVKDAQDKKVQLYTDVAKAKSGVADAIQNTNTQLLDQARPIFAQASAIQARRAEVQGMNPFKRAVLGLVNRNYSDDHLSKMDEATSRELSGIGQRMQLNTSLNDGIANALTSKAADQESVLNAIIEHSGSDIQLASQGLSAARTKLGDLSNELGIDSDIMRTQQAQSEHSLQGLTTQTAAAAEAEAAKSGFATIGGAKLSLGQIKDRRIQLQGQDMELAARGLSLANQRMDLADHQERKAIDHMSPADIEAAIASGGVYRGHQLSMSNLADAGRAHAQVAALGADQATGASQARAFTGQVDQFVGSGKEILGRSTQLFGSRMPSTMAKFYGDRASQISQMSDAIKNAKDPMVKRQLMAQASQAVAGWQGDEDKMLDTMFGKTMRNPDSIKLYKAYVRGDAVDPDTATRGAIGLMQSGGLPPGVKAGTPEYQSWQAGAAAVSKASNEADAQKLKGAERDRYIMSHTQEAVGNAWGSTMGSQYMNAIPTLAKHVGDPFGQVNPRDWSASHAAGDANGYKRMAAKWGVSPDQARQLMDPNDPNGQRRYQAIAIDGKTGQVKDGFDRSTMQRELTGAQQSEFLRALDASPSARPGFIPSHALADFVKSGQWQGAVTSHADAQNNNIGAYLADSISGGSIRQKIQNYAGNISMVADTNHAEALRTQSEMIGQYGNDPVRRAAVILAGTGVDQHQQQVLLQHIQEAAGKAPPGMSSSEFIDAFIGGAGGKFQNPTLEKARQVAAKEWQVASARADAHMRALAGAAGTQYNVGGLHNVNAR